ncbi:wax ester/triacylglycerol synthase domain-containing protein [Nocardia sp. NPDC057440]|uniref:wax ester/triacylglycerol synthase domain-containing protein n=1 Tax=Nocardia sp. NPDC057440 TaxID=3346134 RepID=UPI00367310E6
MSSVAPQDATMYWLSKRTRNDLFLLYCFADSGSPAAELRELVARRSARIPDLRVRLREVPADLGYPSWIPCDFAAEQFVEHLPTESNWPTVLNELGKLLGTVLDAAVRPWRLHLFRDVIGVPGQPPDAAPVTVVVLQMSHALADGRRAARIARALFSESDTADQERTGSRPRTTPPRSAPAGFALLDAARTAAAVGLLRMPIQVMRTAVRGYHAYRSQRELAELTAAGQVPAPGPDFTPSLVNPSAEVGDSDHRVRMIVRTPDQLRIPDRTVTVVVLTAVSLALTRYLHSRGAQVDRLGAQVPMSLPGASAPRNNYRSLGVDLFVGEPDIRLRSRRIADALGDRIARAGHPLLAAQDRVTAVVPAALLRRDIDRYPLDTVPDSIAGHTVVSSVHRGPADLTFGGGRVLFTAGFPALGSVMHLTHGVHGLSADTEGRGATITISIHADSTVLPDIDAYAELLVAALGEIAQAHEAAGGVD